MTWPLLLAGFGVGVLASQLGCVTVSAVPDGQGGGAGGVQDAVTSFGAWIGAVLAGGVPFLSGRGLRARLGKGRRAPRGAGAVVTGTADVRIGGLWSSLALLAMIALIALSAARRVPPGSLTSPPGNPSLPPASWPPPPRRLIWLVP